MTGAQLVICTILVVLTLTMSAQIGFLKGKDLGFDDDHLIVVQRNGIDKSRFF